MGVKEQRSRRSVAHRTACIPGRRPGQWRVCCYRCARAASRWPPTRGGNSSGERLLRLTFGMLQLGGVIDNWTITNKTHTRTTQDTQIYMTHIHTYTQKIIISLSLDRSQAHLFCFHTTLRSTVTRRSHVSYTTARSRQVSYTTAEWRCPMSRRKSPTPLRPR